MDEKLFDSFIDSRHLSMPPQPQNPTFADVLNRYVFIKEKQGSKTVNAGIGRGWKEKSTINKVKSYFNNTFLVEMNKMFGRNRALSTLGEQDFDRLLDLLGTLRERNDDTRARDDRYIYLVLEAAANHGAITYNEYRGKSLRTAIDVERQVSPTLLKSLTPVQDLLVYRFVTENPETVHGEVLGIFLMHMFGLRNGEAAGADFGDIRKLSSGIYSLFIWKTAMLSSNERQFSGKTWNAVRDLPMIKIAELFINKRRAFLEQEVAAGHVKDINGELVHDVNKLPIACRGINYGIPCSANDLTRVGKRVLMAAKVSDAEFRDLDRYVKLGMFDEDGWDDKDPTSYLLRRSYATHLRLLGVPDSTRKYLIGHNTDDQQDTRVSYENEDKLNAVHEFLRQHPLNWLFQDDEAWGVKSVEQLTTKVRGTVINLPNEVISADTVIQIHGTGKEAWIDVEALQAIGTLQIEMKVLSQADKAKPVQYSASSTGVKRKPDQHVDTSWENNKVYLTTLNRLVRTNRSLIVHLEKE